MASGASRARAAQGAGDMASGASRARAAQGAGDTASWDTIDRYMVLSSDTHAGAETRAYKAYLDREWHDDFEAWAASITNPWIDLRDPDAAAVNWDSDK